MRLVTGLLAILLIAGCSEKDQVPSGIIPREKMEKILWDMVQADQYAAVYVLKDSARANVKTETMKLYQEVFLLHQVSREDFSKSFLYYREHPELTKNVFDSLLSKGNRLRAETYSRPALPPRAVLAPGAPSPGPGPIFTKPGVLPPPHPVSGTPGTGPGRVMAPNPVTGKPEIRPGQPAPTDTVRGRNPR